MVVAGAEGGKEIGSEMVDATVVAVEPTYFDNCFSFVDCSKIGRSVIGSYEVPLMSVRL